MATVAKIQGMEALLKKLDGLSKKEANKALRKALRAGAKIVQAKAKQTIPRKSGKGAKALKVRAAKRSRKKGPGVMVIADGKNNLFKGDSFYLGFQEYGWKTGKRKHGNSGAVPVGGDKFVTLIGGKRRRKQVAGLHWLKRAAEQSEGAAREAIARVLEAELRQTLAGK